MMFSRLGRTNIKVRILCLPVLFLFAVLLLEGLNMYVTNAVEERVTYPKVGEHILNGYRETLKAVTEVEASTLAEKVKNAKTREEKMAIVFNETDPIRFFGDKSGYFFSYDMNGVRINVPINKADNGTNMMHLADPKGNRLVENLVKAAQKGGGFTEYWFEKEGKGIQPKLAYAHPVPGTDFLIGTGVYIDNVETQTNALRENIQSTAREYLYFGLAVLAAVMAVSFLLSLLIARSVTTSINKTVKGLIAGAEQVAAASSQVSSSSRQLAEGASEQAASIEETSSSLEEMSSMIRQNAENANHASQLTSSTRDTVSLAGLSMEKLTASMVEISTASEETSKIIKTIDEIAFQTNLLALNAAVEAARAGEAGAGFAVVADEVRNLAMRAADAARNTAGLIEGTVKKIKDGSQLVVKTEKEFREVAVSVQKSSELVDEITVASREQSNGIDQINKAVGEMDKVVQMNAASAEESASASQQLHSQAQHMEDLVGELIILAGGTSGVKGGTANPAAAPGARKVTATVTASSRKSRESLPANAAKPAKMLPVEPESRQIDPSRLIPLDEEDMKDF
ncbi:MAG: methyl-accepting chemotaxis protein [Desulfobacteraceae bacterium]|nr:methyl-accepting chemotaxis protein [Desulfobacteraceae bacterium]